ncbi:MULTISPECIES: basic amino acid/polyamine antiporter [Streptomyces]|uniref:Basic amino acid/polyamine antiporter n=1 Tax=Streptomyces mirabilis TaxID=68239 RepID=A0ABU3V0F6_9ACTN|nr:MULTISPECIES: basic amino acid/polyamine antiporter [Streptomyces]MCX4616239.1 basic amino acid/polyamine antiporter [Streptomyces mirabilis]MCX5346998.1 basic amino acid/polyamine antiporter [Streptomyces mirabilis]MDU8999663.1 basic amino acid/polyamine antiporter [Streptomyces mirabilis]QDN85719.1 amino acid permease [Streptomyces sp. RLB3-6]QDO06548.1 amino acid permease [Streptomyces sp. S1D4-23]
MTQADTETHAPPAAKLTLPTLTTMVVGSMVGAGVFSLPRLFAQETGVAGALIAWAVAGTGMLMLAFVFQRLAVRRPDLDAGVYAYAKAGFGEYLGFFSAFGYWASACVGNVTYWVLIMSTIGAVAPALGDGDTLLAVALSSVGLWCFFFLIRRGVKEAAAINRIVTVAKVVPILVFVVLALFYLKPRVFAENFAGADYAGSLFNQVKGTMLATVFVFLGVEGASVYSRHARRREDVGRATVLGFLSVFAVFASVTIVSYGLLPMSEIAELRQPSMAGVLESAVGTWGKAFVSVGLIVSVLGAYLAWTLMAAEVLFVAAEDEDMPRFLGRSTAADVPVPALLMTTLLTQVVLVVTLFSDDAFSFALDLTSALTLIPFLLAAAFALKTARGSPGGDLAVAALATLYTAFLLYAAGPKYVLVSFIVYAPATVLFVMARREQGRRLFSPRELVILLVSIAGAVLGIVALALGWISL